MSRLIEGLLGGPPVWIGLKGGGRVTSRERLLTAMRRGKPDRLPIHIRGVRVWDEKWVESRHPSYGPVIEAVRRHCDWVASWSPVAGLFLTAARMEARAERIDLDERWALIKTTLHTPKGPLTSIHQVSKTGMPGLRRKFWVESEEDLEKFLSIPYMPPRPDVKGFFELERRIGDRGIVMVGLSDPIAYVHDLLGSELLAIWSVERRDLVKMLVGIFAERLTDLVSYLLESGVRGVYGFSGEEYVAPPLHSPSDFREFVALPEKRIFDLIHSHGSLVHVHCHGRLRSVLDMFVEMGVDCLHPVEPPPLGDLTLREAKERLKGKVCVEGNVQIGDIYSEEPSKFEAKVRKVVSEGAEGGGFILCPTASPHTPVLPERAVLNYLTMIRIGLTLG